jgi:hypothetical protein
VGTAGAVLFRAILVWAVFYTRRTCARACRREAKFSADFIQVSWVFELQHVTQVNCANRGQVLDLYGFPCLFAFSVDNFVDILGADHTLRGKAACFVSLP